jgi:hypothetical protein
MLPLGILAIALAVLFEVYKSDFERWVKPLSDWLKARKAWSWVLPVAILFILSFPPLFGHEIVLLVVGVSLGTNYVGPRLLTALIADVSSWSRAGYCVCWSRSRRSWMLVSVD